MFIIKEGTPADKIGTGTPKEVKESIASWLESEGYTVRNAEQDESFLESQKATSFDSGYGKAMKEVETALEETTTEKKKDRSEKASDYIKRVYGEMSEKATKATELSEKIAELEKNGIDGNSKAQEYKAELEALQKTYSDMKDEYEAKISERDANLFKSKVQSQIENDVAEISQSLDKTINPEIMRDVVENRISKFYKENNAHQSQGQIVFKDEAGQIKMSKKDGKPMGSKEILANYFEDLVDKGRQAGGAGSGRDDGGGSGGDDGQEYSRPENIKTKVELHAYLTDAESGLKLDPSTKEFAEAYSEMGKDLPLR